MEEEGGDGGEEMEHTILLVESIGFGKVHRQIKPIDKAHYSSYISMQYKYHFIPIQVNQVKHIIMVYVIQIPGWGSNQSSLNP